jgi:hypothetical protein
MFLLFLTINLLNLQFQYDWIKTTICQNSDTPPSWCDGSTSCKDSPFRLKVLHNGKYRYRSCGWIAKDTDRCSYYGASSHCPVTCGTCSTCKDTPTSFKLNSNGRSKIKDCSWANKWRCSSIEGLANTCGETCGTCAG